MQKSQHVLEPAMGIRKYKLFIKVTEATKYRQLILPGTHNTSIKKPVKS